MIALTGLASDGAVNTAKIGSRGLVTDSQTTTLTGIVSFISRYWLNILLRILRIKVCVLFVDFSLNLLSLLVTVCNSFLDIILGLILHSQLAGLSLLVC